jgi:hypothetical protein
MYDFTATARSKDDRLAFVVAYRGFSAKNQKADRAGVAHVTLPDPIRASSNGWRTPLWMNS